MKRFIVVLLMLLPLVNLFAQERGFPILRNYTPKEYNGEPQVWSAVQDSRGIMSFGVGDGVLEYDGISWRTIPIAKQAGCYNLAIDAKGKMYVGANNEFGYLVTTKNGHRQYQSLKDSTLKLGAITSIKFTSKFVYFQCPEAILQYSPTTEKITTFKADTNGRFIGDFVHKDTYYIRLSKKGLMKIENNELKPAIQSEFFKDKNGFRGASPMTADTWLLPTRNQGLYLYQPDTDSLPKPFAISKQDFFVDNNMYTSALFRTKYVVLGSINRGVLMTDKHGKTIQHYEERTLLQNNTVYGIGTDTTQNIWITLSNGITKTQHSLDLSYWDKHAGLKGTITGVIRFRKTIYLASGTKMYFIDTTNQIQEVQNIAAGQNWAFLEFIPPSSTSKKDTILLAGTSSGVYEIHGASATQIYKGGHALKVVQSLKNPARIFTTDGDDFVSLRYENGKWISEGKWAGINDYKRGMLEDEYGDIWFGTYRNGVIRVTPNNDTIAKPKKIRYYTEKDGLTSLADILPFMYKHKIIWGTKKGLHTYNYTTDRFEPFCEFGEQFCNGSRDVFTLQEMPDGKVWICPLENKKAQIGYVQPNGKGGYDWIYAPFLRIPEMYLEAFYIEPTGIAWIGGSEGIYRYDMSQDTKNYSQSFECLIRKVSIGIDSILYGGNPTASKPIEKLSYAYNDLKFQFAAPFFDQEEQTLYSFQLEGFDENWSEWSRQSEKEYTNLAEGNYTFKVKAKNMYGVIGEMATYQLTILPPYYRTWWAYLSYILGAIFTMYGVVKWNMQRLVLEKTNLENIVKERTAEVVGQAEEINEQNKSIKQLSEIGKELTASLNLEHILSTLYTYINEMMDASVFGIGLYDAEQGLIDYQLAIENGLRYKPYTRDMKDKNQFSVWCIENRQEIVLNDIENEYSRYLQRTENQDYNFQLEDGNKYEYPKSLLYVPLLIKGEVIGIITVQSFHKNKYTQQHLNQLKSIANYASIAIENAAQQKEIAEANDDLNQFNEELRQQQEELVMLNENLEVQKQTVEKTYAQLKLTSEQLEKSIHYASHIQEVVMPELTELYAYFSEVFVIFKPKDVVSGDFYWFSKINDNLGVFALADCTGHGVPGAFMSMLACTLLHETVNVKKLYNDPARVLKNIHAALQKLLKQREGKNIDGMDISICCFEKMENQQVQLIFAGAKSKMFYILDNQLYTLLGDKQYLGGKNPLKKDFTNQEFSLSSSTQFYLFSDGFADQNDAERIKIGSKNFENIIFENSLLPFSEQKEKLEQLLLGHQGTETQRDDISVVGLKI